MFLKRYSSYSLIISCVTCLVLFFSLPQAFAAGAAFDKEEYKIDEEAFIIVRDYDKNKDPAIQDIFTINVTSDSAPEGRQVVVAETERDSGFFEGGIQFTKHKDHSKKLHVTVGDRIYIHYEDFLEIAKILGEPIFCGKNMISVDDQSCILKSAVGFDPHADFEVKTFQKRFNRGDTIRILGFTIYDYNATTNVSLKIINPELKTILEEKINTCRPG